jgi:hypothetical protein
MNTESARHYCRNPRCRMKLPAPVENHPRAFCCRGCYDSFFLNRCLVCERDTRVDPMTGQPRTRGRQFCGRECRSEKSRFPHVYAPPATKKARYPLGASSSSKSAHSTGIKIGDEGDRATAAIPRGWWWGGDPDGGDHSLYDRDGLTAARVVLEPDGRYHLRSPIAYPPQSWPDLDTAMRGAVSFALACLPVDPKVAARIKRDNETSHPMGPPSGSDRAPVETTNFKIRECGANTYLDPGPIPEFLRRAK